MLNQAPISAGSRADYHQSAPGLFLGIAHASLLDIPQCVLRHRTFQSMGGMTKTGHRNSTIEDE